MRNRHFQLLILDSCNLLVLDPSPILPQPTLCCYNHPAATATIPPLVLIDSLLQLKMKGFQALVLIGTLMLVACSCSAARILVEENRAASQMKFKGPSPTEKPKLPPLPTLPPKPKLTLPPQPKLPSFGKKCPPPPASPVYTSPPYSPSPVYTSPPYSPSPVYKSPPPY
ncbi:uncharacterized protein [Physcomitrium patens]|uniref:Uncharacterized protein n=1 Tax=Physcomitrium patens TaxID=3218 RepID=A0A7I4A0X4_PHYPA|nr:extensin-3-like [Physcomitrium patens]|eukprot:XP_024378024.1 extensin-3-like [Physcomitrella patens]